MWGLDYCWKLDFYYILHSWAVMMPEWWYECNDSRTAKPTESEWKLLRMVVERKGKAFKNGRQQKMQMRIGLCLLPLPLAALEQLLLPHSKVNIHPCRTTVLHSESVNHSCFDYSRRSDIFSCTNKAEKKKIPQNEWKAKMGKEKPNPQLHPAFSYGVCCCHIIPFFNKI